MSSTFETSNQMEFVPQVMTRSNKSKMKKKTKKSSMDSLLKVVYISSPMKVKTSASRFRTLVQELTGRDSDISRYMDTSNNNCTTSDDNTRESHHHEFEILPDIKRVSQSTADNHRHHHDLTNSSSSLCSPSSSESNLVDEHEDGPPTFDEAFINEHFFQGLLSADLFSQDCSEIDVLGSYDAL